MRVSHWPPNLGFPCAPTRPATVYRLARRRIT
jgi:hypothetical protein